MTFDLFGDPEPEVEAKPSVPPPVKAAPRPDVSSAAAHRAAWEASRKGVDQQPCLTARRGEGRDYRCRVGGGSAAFSDNMGHSHFCMLHRPYGFLPSERFGHWLTKP